MTHLLPGRRVLAIDCATPACSVALFESGALVAGAYEEIGRGHAERLVPMIAELPDKGRADIILVSLGPGSFTGVRIGLAAARALGLAWGAEVLGYPTLALVAAMAREQGAAQVTVCMAGGHGEWFVQDFDAAGMPEGEVASLTPAAAERRGCYSHVVGSRAEELAASQLDALFVSMMILPDARRTLLLPGEFLIANLAPIYGRAPDARLPKQIG